MKNLLVTGGCGFIGANFVRYLLEESGFKGRVINIDKLTYAGNPQNVVDLQAKYPHRYVFQQVDICDKMRLNEIFSYYSIDAICHFAAESHVDRSIHSPDAFIQTNVVGTLNLLEVAREHQGRLIRFHHISTDEVYGSLGRSGHFTEDSPYSPNNPYSASKASSDHLVRAYSNTYGLPVTISNCSNNYGPYQFPEKLIPLTISNILEGKDLPVYGNGSNMRDWLYVRDHCTAVWQILQHGRLGETYNIGGNNDLSNLEVVHTLCDALGIIHEEIGIPVERDYRELITFVSDRPGHDWRYAIDAQKLMRELGWRPQETFESGIARTIHWYMENQPWVSDIKTGQYRQWIDAHYNGGQAASLPAPLRSEYPHSMRFC